jgi:hypothetical protein
MGCGFLGLTEGVLIGLSFAGYDVYSASNC